MNRWLAAIVVLSAALCMALWNSFYVGFFNDDVMYIALARALATGQGYTEILFPGAPPHLKYPPGFPLMLLPMQALSPAWFGPMKAVGVFCALATVVLTWKLFDDQPPAVRWGTTVLLACNPFVVRYAATVLSDVPFMMLTTLYLVLSRRQLDSPRGCALLGALTAVSFYVRTVGAVLAVATVLTLLWRRAGWRSLFAYVGAFGFLMLPFFLRQGHIGYQGDVVTNYGQTAAWRIALSNAMFYFASLPLAIWADPIRWTYRLVGPNPDILLWFACVATWVAIAAGIARERRPALTGVLFVVYGGVFVMWPYTDVRFFLPVFPLLIGYFLRGVHALVPRATVGLSAAIVALLLVCSALTVAGPNPEEHDATRETYAWIAAHTPPQDAVMAFGGALWLYTGRPVAVLPGWTGSPEGAIREVVRGRGDWVLIRSGGGPDASDAPWMQALDGRPSLFRRVYDNAAESTAIYQIVGDRQRYLTAYDHFVRGVGALQEEHWDDGLKALDACLALEPDFPPAVYDRAIALWKSGHPDLAERALDGLLAQHPDHARGRALRDQIRAEHH